MQTLARGYSRNGLSKTLLTTDGTGATVASHTLAYIAGGVYLNGHRVADTFRLANPDSGAPCRTSDCTASWEYDGRERLTKEITGTGVTSEFTLDVAGNVTEEKRNGAVYRSATYTAQRLASQTQSGVTTTFLYDGQGNLDCLVASGWASASCPAAASGQSVDPALLQDLVYDYRDRLVAARSYANGVLADRAEVRYDPLGRPVRRLASEAGSATTSELVYLGVSDALVRETETGAASKSRWYGFDALGQRATLSETVSGSTSRFSYVADPRGSVEALLDQTGTVKAAYGYHAYGEPNPALTTTAAGFDASTNVYRYSGKRYDPASGLYDMGARHYSATAGRFLQHDLYTGALANLELSLDPLTGNRYALAAGNPVSYIETDGHKVELAPGQQNVRSPITELRRDVKACAAGHDPSCRRAKINGGDLPEIVASVACGLIPSCAGLWLADDIAHRRAADAAVGVVPGGRLLKPFKNLLRPSKAAKGGTAIRRVGDVLESPYDALANPQLLAGKSPQEVVAAVRGAPGWRIEALGKGSHKGQGLVLRQYTDAGNPTGTMIRWHPGGGHHGPDPYWRVINSRTGFKSGEIR